MGIVGPIEGSASGKRRCWLRWAWTRRGGRHSAPAVLANGFPCFCHSVISFSCFCCFASLNRFTGCKAVKQLPTTLLSCQDDYMAHKRTTFFISLFAVFICNHQFNASRVGGDFSWPETSHEGGSWSLLRRHLFQTTKPSKGKPKSVETTERVTGGVPAEEGRHPYMCAIYTSGSSQDYQCGGFLIHPRWVMTAAHCVSPETPAHNAIVTCGIYRDAAKFDESKVRSRHDLKTRQK